MGLRSCTVGRQKKQTKKKLCERYRKVRNSKNTLFGERKKKTRTHIWITQKKYELENTLLYDTNKTNSNSKTHFGTVQKDEKKNANSRTHSVTTQTVLGDEKR